MNFRNACPKFPMGLPVWEDEVSKREGTLDQMARRCQAGQFPPRDLPRGLSNVLEQVVIIRLEAGRLPDPPGLPPLS